MIVQELHAIQKTHGYLPTAELKALAERTATPLYRLQEVASFFPHFRRTPPPAVRVQVCRDMSCQLRGACELREKLRGLSSEFGPEKLGVEGVSCLGRCDRAPAVMINEQLYVQRPDDQLLEIVRQTVAGQHPPPDHDAAQPRQSRPPWQIDVYQGEPRYEAIKKYVQRPNPQELLDQLKLADLRGMGGAGAWAHQKWADVWRATGTEKYIVCNGDESEPGTFKDRELLLRTPYLVLEGVILAGLMTGATRATSTSATSTTSRSRSCGETIRQAEQAGVCGRNVLGTRAAVSGGGLRQPRRLHLRRAERLDRGDGRPSGRAAQPAAATGDQWPLRQAHPVEQRRDLCLDAGHLAQGRRVVSRARCARLPGPAVLLDSAAM